MKKQLLICLIAIITICKPGNLRAQTDSIVYTDAATLYMSGKPFNTVNPYQRVDTARYPALPAPVKRLLTHSAGLAVCFTSNSTSISAKWCINKPLAYANMTTINSQGLNLYVQKNGKWQFAGVAKPGNKKCTQALIVENMEKGDKKFLLYLPTYNELNSLEIGVERGCTIKSMPGAFKKRVAVYGSSVTQGASASRSGLAYPAVLSRHLGYDFINIGMSGSAKMEPAVVAMVNDVEADAYLLDCIPNASVQQIKDRTLNMVMAIQKAHPGKPIILLNSISREQGFVDMKMGATVIAQNRATDSIANILLKKHTKDFYFIDVKNFFGDDHEASTDYAHPNDLGFYRFVQKLEPMVADILKKYF
ncbi:SGNH/GDSL hydrolase family protein [Mucilaginibacter sp. UR6-11]|uniref:SGNH/GDSL hydrolase family protein n=1 Tax=Mucilaginibacter sp. UR6-11 TaxID=1435644 RepID=UPI001E369717|nr:SGNH/GDSL hydrolase family protein [Mucilaginibacter sp. UR6-11]MCC8424581.1 SGNH/GDSL hydrolase family protein [Mucilaginibacter sp. UR6-11]